MKKSFYLALTLILVIESIALISCNSNPNKISESQMVTVMSDLIVLEAGNQISYNYAVLPDSIWVRDYRFVCQKHKIDYDDFCIQLKYYKDAPKEFGLLMEKVITQIQMAELKARNTDQ